MYRKAGALLIPVPFGKIKTHLYSVPLAVPLAVPLKFTALTFTIKLFISIISNTWPKGYGLLCRNNLPLIFHDGSAPPVRLQVNIAISSGGINITLDGPWAMIVPSRQ